MLNRFDITPPHGYSSSDFSNLTIYRGDDDGLPIIKQANIVYSGPMITDYTDTSPPNVPGTYRFQLVFLHNNGKNYVTPTFPLDYFPSWGALAPTLPKALAYNRMYHNEFGGKYGVFAPDDSIPPPDHTLFTVENFHSVVQTVIPNHTFVALDPGEVNWKIFGPPDDPRCAPDKFVYTVVPTSGTYGEWNQAANAILKNIEDVYGNVVYSHGGHDWRIDIIRSDVYDVDIYPLIDGRSPYDRQHNMRFTEEAFTAIQPRKRIFVLDKVGTAPRYLSRINYYPLEIPPFSTTNQQASEYQIGFLICYRYVGRTKVLDYVLKDFTSDQLGSRDFSLTGTKSLSLTRYADAGTRTDGVTDHGVIGRSYKFDGGVRFKTTTPFSEFMSKPFDIEIDVLLTAKDSYLVGTMDPMESTAGWWLSIGTSSGSTSWLEFGVKDDSGKMEIYQGLSGQINVDMIHRFKISRRGNQLTFANAHIGTSETVTFKSGKTSDTKLCIGGTDQNTYGRLNGYVRMVKVSTET